MKKLFVFTLLSIALFQGHTQNTDYYDRMEHVFGNIDQSKVTTGFLKVIKCFTHCRCNYHNNKKLNTDY